MVRSADDVNMKRNAAVTREPTWKLGKEVEFNIEMTTTNYFTTFTTTTLPILAAFASATRIT